MSDKFSIDSIMSNIVGKCIGLNGDISFTREFLVTDYILTGLKNNDVICIATLAKSANDLIDELSKFSDEATMLVNEAILNERLQIIDMYSFRSGIPEDVAPGTYYLSSASDLTLLSIHLNKVSKQFPNIRFLLMPFSLLTIYSKDDAIINFVQTLVARISARKQTCLLVMDRGVIDENTLLKLESVIDGMIEMIRFEEMGELKEKFRIKFMRGIPETPYFNWNLIS